MWQNYTRRNSNTSSHAYTETGYLPENFLPEFLDLVVWGHEHECLINPRYNPEMNFHVMQPGSSVATSLMPGEAVTKHVAIVSVTGRDFKVEPIRLKTVRPFVMKEIVLSEETEAKKLAKKDNRTMLTQYLIRVVEGLIQQAKDEWLEAQEDGDSDEEPEVPLPLIRLRVEYSAPDGGNFDCENPQRFSNRFVGKVANVNDVVQFYRKKAGSGRKAPDGVDLPEESILAQLSIDSVKVEKLVREFLTAQSLTILPQNSFGDAVSQFVDKDDKHAMEMFVNESLMDQIKHLMEIDHADEEEIQNAMDAHKSKLEELFAAGRLKRTKRAKLKPRPPNWDSDLDGEWEAQPAALVRSDMDEGAEEEEEAPLASTARGRGKAAAPGKAPVAARKAPNAKAPRGKKKVVEEESDEEDEDIIMVESDEGESQLFVKPARPAKATRKPAPPKKSAPPAKRTSARGASSTTKQATLDFSQPPSQSRGRAKKAPEVPADDISDDDDDDDDAFEPAPSTTRTTRSRR
jgi:double-strand break repair protein MRE11